MASNSLPWRSLTAAAAAAAGGGALCALRYLSTSPLPKEGWEKRAWEILKFWKHIIQTGATFDSLLGENLQFDEVKPDGTLRCSLTAVGTMLSRDGTLHEGGLMCIIDDVTGMAVWIKALVTGVSVDIRFTALEPVREGERLSVESKAIRVGSTMAYTSFEMRRADDGVLVAVGAQTKHIGIPVFRRALLRLGAAYLPFGMWLIKRGQRKSDKIRDGLVAAKKIPPLKRLSATPQERMEDVLGLQPLPQEGGGPQTQFWAFILMHHMNGYWGGHGAASAALFAAAARAYAESAGVEQPRCSQVQCSYYEPVPAFKPIGVMLTPLIDSKGARQIIAELKNDKGQVFVRGFITL